MDNLILLLGHIYSFFHSIYNRKGQVAARIEAAERYLQDPDMLCKRDQYGTVTFYKKGEGFFEIWKDKLTAPTWRLMKRKGLVDESHEVFESTQLSPLD
ncbi:hypothetical protein [Neptuniibacter sp. QD37_11]|uniref:hypothetical protein n=1 Tax=Neptuniibacter sp. QD37_11 TaxID=3398209 RepID=UPI0039F61481